MHATGIATSKFMRVAASFGLAGWLLTWAFQSVIADVETDNSQAQVTDKAEAVSAAKAATENAVSNKQPEAQSDDAKAIAERQAAADSAKRALARAKGEVSFDDLKFDIEKDGDFKRSMLTKEIEELNKKNIRIRGYILPQSVFSSSFDEFVLVRDNQECCFGPGAALYDCIMVMMEKGQSARFATRPVVVKGRFEIKEFKYPDSEKHYAIYQLIATEVK